MTGFKPQTSGVGSDCSALLSHSHCPTLPYFIIIFIFQSPPGKFQIQTQPVLHFRNFEFHYLESCTKHKIDIGLRLNSRPLPTLPRLNLSNLMTGPDTNKPISLQLRSVTFDSATFNIVGEHLSNSLSQTTLVDVGQPQLSGSVCAYHPAAPGSNQHLFQFRFEMFEND